MALGKTPLPLNPDYFLNTALCQFTSVASKTQQAIEFIKHYSLLARFNRGQIENGVHHITVILTNRSLLETQNWEHRLNDKTRGLKIKTLSSKQEASFNSIDEIITHLTTARNPNQLMDMLLMCTHGVRTEDIITLVDTLENGNLYFGNMGIRQITLTIMFDEADKNTPLIVDFIKRLSKIFEDKNINTTVRDVHFITATAFGPTFWKPLEKANIKQLKNIKHALKESPNVVKLSHEELLRDYRKINDHNIKNDIENMTDDPVFYASLILQKILARRNQTNEVLTVFAPAEILLTSHYNMVALFHANGFVCLILNGEKKGFETPDGTFIPLEHFNGPNFKGELYDTLVKWRRLNPTTNLAITGYLNVERGVTFCTRGFSFTDMIVSSYHLHNIASLIQILGRANGTKEYVEIMNIWSPKKVIEKANEQIDILNELHARDPEIYIESDFRRKTKREIMDVAMTVPDVIPITQEEFTEINTTKKGKVYNKQKILDIIGKHNPELSQRLSSMEKKQITQPGTGDTKDNGEASIKKHITDFISAHERRVKYSIDITKKDIEKKTNLYQIFIDKTEGAPKLIVSIFLGEQLKENTEE